MSPRHSSLLAWSLAGLSVLLYTASVLLYLSHILGASPAP